MEDFRKPARACPGRQVSFQGRPEGQTGVGKWLRGTSQDVVGGKDPRGPCNGSFWEPIEKHWEEGHFKEVS